MAAIRVPPIEYGLEYGLSLILGIYGSQNLNLISVQGTRLKKLARAAILCAPVRL